MTGDALAWLDLGPAEFDARRLPKGHMPAAAEQAGLFFVAVPPGPAKSSALGAELPGQIDIFEITGPAS